MEAFNLFIRMIDRCQFHPELLVFLISEIEESNLLDVSEKIVLLQHIKQYKSTYEKALNS